MYRTSVTSKDRQTGVCLDYIYVIIAFHPRFLSHSYKKNVPWHILAPSAVAGDMFLLRASVHPRGVIFIS